MAEEKIVLSFREYLRRQKEEALGAYNMYFCWQKMGHSPNESEAVWYYIESGGSSNFAKRYIPAEAILPDGKAT